MEDSLVNLAADLAVDLAADLAVDLALHLAIDLALHLANALFSVAPPQIDTHRALLRHAVHPARAVRVDNRRARRRASSRAKMPAEHRELDGEEDSDVNPHLCAESKWVFMSTRMSRLSWG
eukprot:2098169-Pleurochrysis_carterae.AAC.2